jgi:hypothetical protein
MITLVIIITTLSLIVVLLVLLGNTSWKAFQISRLLFYCEAWGKYDVSSFTLRRL